MATVGYSRQKRRYLGFTEDNVCAGDEEIVTHGQVKVRFPALTLSNLKKSDTI